MSDLDSVPCRRGPSPAERIGDLFRRHQAHLFRLALRMTACREDAADLTQETFLRAARHLDKLPEAEGEVETWLVRVMINDLRDRERRRKVRREKAPLLPVPRIRSDPEARSVARATVHRALKRLSARRRAILVLYELEELPTERIAELLRLTRATVRWHVHRGRRELRDLLGARRIGS